MHHPSGDKPSGVFGRDSSEQVREKVSLMIYVESFQVASSKSLISAGISAAVIGGYESETRASIKRHGNQFQLFC